MVEDERDLAAEEQDGLEAGFSAPQDEAEPLVEAQTPAEEASAPAVELTPAEADEDAEPASEAEQIIEEALEPAVEAAAEEADEDAEPAPQAERPADEEAASDEIAAEPASTEEAVAAAPLGAAPAEAESDGRAWYVVHCYSGYENKVRHNLEQRIESMGMKDMIFDVVVPTEEEIEVKEGKRRTVERRVFPGYILVNMLMNEESWYVVRNTPGVTSFVGQGNQPLPLRPEEVAQIVKRMEAEAPRIKVTFRQGERVRIVDGPFNDFRGTVSEIDMERAKVRVMVNFFGRETPVELDFLQVEKA